MLALCFSLPVAAVAAGKDVPSAAVELHKKGQYEAAVTRGLADLLSQPWNHELRFIVADSLQRVGKIDEAVTQLEALEGTALAQTASARLQALRKPEQLPTRASAPVAAPVAAPAREAALLRPAADVPGIAVRQLAQYQYISPSGSSIAVEGGQGPGAPGVPNAQAIGAGASVHSPAGQRIVELSAAGKYHEAGTEGLALLAAEKPDDLVQLIIANCLAWTGRLNEAIQVYQGLTKGKYANEAGVGMANAQRWSGRDERAIPLYRAVLAADPANAGAQEGLAYALRELRPRTTFNAGGSIDSADMQRRSASINHRWRDSGGTNIFEVETSGVRDRLPTAEASQQDITLRYHAPSLALKPSFELSIPNRAEHNVYGSVRLKLGDRDNIVEIGRVNWGKIATNPNALQSHLAASHLGLEASQGLGLGKVTGRLDYYDISDGNAILTANLRLASSWRPLGSHIKPFVGVEMREAKFNTPNYWSPENGFGSMYAGLLGEWSSADWSFYTSGQGGLRLYGDAGTSWSLSAGGKRQLSNDVAIGINLWGMASQRDYNAYRARSVNVNLEKLW